MASTAFYRFRIQSDVDLTKTDMNLMLQGIKCNPTLRKVSIRVPNLYLRHLCEILTHQGIRRVTARVVLAYDQTLPPDPRLYNMEILRDIKCQNWPGQTKFHREINTQMLTQPLGLALRRLTLDLRHMQHLKFDISGLEAAIQANHGLYYLGLRHVIQGNALTECFLRAVRCHDTISHLSLHGDLPVRAIRYLIASNRHITHLECELWFDRRDRYYRLDCESVMYGILQALGYNSTIRRFTFVCNQYIKRFYQSKPDMMDFLRYNQHLRHLDIILSFYKEIYHYSNEPSGWIYHNDFLQALMWNSTLQFSNMLCMNFDTAKLYHIMNLLQYNATIRKIAIHGVQLYDSATTTFMEALLSHRGLRHMEITIWPNMVPFLTPVIHHHATLRHIHVKIYYWVLDAQDRYHEIENTIKPWTQAASENLVLKRLCVTICPTYYRCTQHIILQPVKSLAKTAARIYAKHSTQSNPLPYGFNSEIMDQIPEKIVRLISKLEPVR